MANLDRVYPKENGKSRERLYAVVKDNCHCELKIQVLSRLFAAAPERPVGLSEVSIAAIGDLHQVQIYARLLHPHTPSLLTESRPPSNCTTTTYTSTWKADSRGFVRLACFMV